ncbi:hypothetical protein [Sandaracinobacteroides saxicola]|uniref:Peptidoglycan-binding protein n=1 Tax=Sandaracinobacteroides saxicola TaxID=2759707 RepID=A0A7G5IFX0_9SPHN|nr:hypothetical protein [Sandaracinobacteroides saxicola]QMW22262.1 hypothetical protein H3309_12980 [Sandaracinobacteroides saxicola]
MTDLQPIAAMIEDARDGVATIAQTIRATVWPGPARRDADSPGGAAPVHYQRSVAAAASRTGIPASVISGIINAEVGRQRWDPAAANPRSSALGLGQFLASTWLSEAARPGTAVHERARALGMLDEFGKPLLRARAALLDLRRDGALSIEAVADFARANLRSLGVETGAATGRIVYLAHHLGIGDTRRFLASALPEGQALRLLTAQIGDAQAQAALRRHGSASAAHRTWLESFISRKFG